jgi:hypothetical protein
LQASPVTSAGSTPARGFRATAAHRDIIDPTLVRQEQAMPPISFDDQQIQTIRTSAAPIVPRLRARFLEEVVNALRQHESVGAGTVARVCAGLQRQYLSGAMDRKPAKFKRRAD